MEIKSRARIKGVAKITVEEVSLEKPVDTVHYWGMRGGRPSLYVHVGAEELRELVKERSIWLNRWFSDVVKISFDENTAAFLAAFALFDQFTYIFEIEAGMVVRKTYTPQIPGGCIWADVGLPDFMWEAAYAAYHFKKFEGERRRYAEEVFEALKNGV